MSERGAGCAGLARVAEASRHFFALVAHRRSVFVVCRGGGTAATYSDGSVLRAAESPCVPRPLQDFPPGPAAGDGVRNFRSGDCGGADRGADGARVSASQAGALTVSPFQENVLDPDEFSRRCGRWPGQRRPQTEGRRPDPAGLLRADGGAGFRRFPTDPKEQAALVRFRLKRSVPFDVETAALSYLAQPGAREEGGRGGGDDAARNRVALRSAVPRGGNESGAGDRVVAGGAGTGARQRAERDGQAHRATCSPAGARESAAQAGALPGTAARRTWTMWRRCCCPPSSTWKTTWAAARRG